MPNLVKIPEQAQTLSRAVGEALVVAVVVALAVEPRLLRYFGNEVVSQTFWNAFYSRAPEAYKEAIKELAGADKFAEHARWNVTLDWANEERSVVRLTVDYTNFLKNYSSKPHGLQPYTFAYDSPFSDFPTEVHHYQTICQDSAFDTDLIKDGYAQISHAPDGRLLLTPKSDSQPPYFRVPAGQRYTIKTKVTTYAGTSGHFPLAVVRPTLQFTVQLEGAALPNLYLSLVNPGSGSVRPVVEGSGNEMAGKGAILVPGVFLTGQAVLLSWKSNDLTET